MISLPFQLSFLFLNFEFGIGQGNITLQSIFDGDNSNFKSPECVSANIRVSSVLPVYSISTAPYSNAVSIKDLSSALVNEFGDIYAVAIMTVLNNGVTWEFEVFAKSMTKLPKLSRKNWKKGVVQVQYDIRYGLFYFQPEKDANFVQEIVILTAKDKIRFKVNNESILGTCEDNYIEFTFFKLSTTLKNYLQNHEINLRKPTLSLRDLTEWPLGNFIFKLCPYKAVSASKIFSNVFETCAKSTENLAVKVVTKHVTESSVAKSLLPMMTSVTMAVPTISTSERKTTFKTGSRTVPSTLTSPTMTISSVLMTLSPTNNYSATSQVHSSMVSTGSMTVAATPSTIELDKLSIMPKMVVATISKPETHFSTQDLVTKSTKFSTTSSTASTHALPIFPTTFLTTSSTLAVPSSTLSLSTSSTTPLTTASTTSTIKAKTLSIMSSTTQIFTEIITVCSNLLNVNSSPSRNLTISTKHLGSNLTCRLVDPLTKTSIGAASFYNGVNITVILSSAFTKEALDNQNCETVDKNKLSSFLSFVSSWFSEVLVNYTHLFDFFHKFVELEGYNHLSSDSKHELNTDLMNPAVCLFEKFVISPLGARRTLFVFRKSELPEPTHKYQKQASMSKSITSTTATIPLTSKSSSNKITASFLPTLDRIKIILSFDSGLNLRAFNCSQIFDSSAAFGLNPNCTIEKSQVNILFGTAPTLTPFQTVVMRTAALTEQYIDNSFNNSTHYDTFSVTVPTDAEVPNVVIIPPTNPLKCSLPWLYSSKVISGSGGRNLKYTWFVIDIANQTLISLTDQSTFAFNVSTLAEVTAKIILQGCNFVGICANSTSVLVNVNNVLNDFVVNMVEVPAKPVPSQDITLYAEVEMIMCSGVSSELISNNLFFAWSVNDSIVSRDSVVTFRPKTFTANSLAIIQLNVSYIVFDQSQVYNTSTVVYLTFGSMPLIPVVDSTNRIVSADSEMSIDASQSFDPNTGSTGLEHSWTCDCILEPINTSRLYLALANLTAGLRYQFIDTITSPKSSLTASITVNVMVVKDSLPMIQLRPVTNYEFPMHEYFRMQAYIQTQSSNLTTQWFLFKDSDNSSIDLTLYFSNVIKNFNDTDSGEVVALSMTIPPVRNKKLFNGWPGLQPGIYVLRLVASGANNSAFADYEFTVIKSPGKPIITVLPESDIVAFETSVRFGTNSTADDTLLFRFGLRTVFIDNTISDQWYHQTPMNYFKAILASALPGINASCGVRVAYQGLLEVCDRAGACSTANTSNIIVTHPVNVTSAIESTLQLAISDIDTGNVERAVIRLEAIQAEQCSNTLNSSVVESLISKVNEQLTNVSDANALLKGVIQCVKVINSASNTYIDKVFDLVVRSQNLVFANDKSRRQKRLSAATNLANLAATTISLVPEDAADKLLFAYDRLIRENQNIANAYLNNIVNLLSGFCVQVDSTRIMSSEGDGYTSIQAEGISPDDDAFLTISYSIAGNTSQVVLSKAFQSAYKSYKCDLPNSTICTEVCLASALIANTALHDNTYLSIYFFKNSHTIPQFSNIASNLHYVIFNNPITGNTLTLSSGVTYNLTIPLISYSPSNYYNCFIYINSIWDNSLCTSNNYARAFKNANVMDCKCGASGVMAVYTVSAPAAPHYLSYNEYQLVFNLSSIAECKFSQLSAFINKLVNASQVYLKRFVNYTCAAGSNLETDPATVSVILRPPFMETQVSNSVAIQAINRAVTVGTASTFASNITVTSFTPILITRDLKNDGYARTIPIRFVKALKNVSNDTNTLLTKWITSMSTNMRIDLYRFKNPTFQYNMLFNFTITLPFAGELVASGSTALSAEEISLWIMEQTIYGELDLQEAQTSIDPIGYSEIVKLVPINPTNTLMIILGIVVGVGVVLITMITGGLVFLKLRTDRLIEEHNRNMRMVYVPVCTHRAMGGAASHPLPSMIPFESNGMVLGPTGIIDSGIDTATVYFGQDNQLRMR